MPNLHIDVCEHGFTSVQETRQRIARAVSKLKGDSPVRYFLNIEYPDRFVVNANLKSHPDKTVSDMRLHLAQLFSSLKGEDLVTFAFHCQVEIPATVLEAA